MKRPWMPLYIGDFSADTDHLNATETGIYIRLLMHCWKHGSIPRERRQLALISHCDSRLWHQYEQKILSFFDVVDASTMQQKRVSTELRRSEEISSKRKAAAEQMHSKRKANAMQVHTQSQSQRYNSAGAREANGGRPLAPASAHGVFSRAEWEVILASYKKFDHWSRDAGPDPTMIGCRCPPDLLAKHGIAVVTPP